MTALQWARLRLMLDPVAAVADAMRSEVRLPLCHAAAVLLAVVQAVERHDTASLARLAAVAVNELEDAPTGPTGRRRAGRVGLVMASLRGILRRLAGPGGWANATIVERRLGHVRFKCSTVEVEEALAALAALGELERDAAGRMRLIDPTWPPQPSKDRGQR